MRALSALCAGSLSNIEADKKPIYIYINIYKLNEIGRLSLPEQGNIATSNYNLHTTATHSYIHIHITTPTFRHVLYVQYVRVGRASRSHLHSHSHSIPSSLNSTRVTTAGHDSQPDGGGGKKTTWCPVSVLYLSVQWYGMVWYGMVWYGMAWYGMAWHGMELPPCLPSFFFSRDLPSNRDIYLVQPAVWPGHVQHHQPPFIRPPSIRAYAYHASLHLGVTTTTTRFFFFPHFAGPHLSLHAP